MWLSVLHHVCGEHEWADGECTHGPLVSTENGKAFLEMDSKPHKAVRQHLPVQKNVSEQLVGGDTRPIFTAFVFLLIAHIQGKHYISTSWDYL